MASKRLNETKQLQEVNSNLKINVNEAEFGKMLTKVWKKSEPYLTLMQEYQNSNANSAINWNQHYEKEYQKFIKSLLGEKIQFNKIPKKKSLLSKKALTKNIPNEGKDLFLTRVIDDYQTLWETREPGLEQPRQNFLNNNETALARLAAEVESKASELEADEKTNNFKLYSSPEEFESIISKLNPNQQRLIRQRDEQYGRFKSQTQGVEINNSSEEKNDALAGFNMQVKKYANNWGLNQNQLQLLSRRDFHPSEWKQHMKEVLHKKGEHKTINVINPDHVIQKRDQMVKASLSRSLGRTKKQIGGKYISNFLKEESKRKPIFKTNLYLTSDMTNQINPLGAKISNNSQKLSSKIEPIVPNLSFVTAINNSQNEYGVRQEQNVLKPNARELDEYVSTVDPKKRPNLKKLKYGNNYDKNNFKAPRIKLLKKQLILEEPIAKPTGEKLASGKSSEAEETLYVPKKLKDYQIDYVDSTKTPNLTIDLAAEQYTFAGYHPREIREIHRQQLGKVQERLVKQKLIQKNIQKEQRYQKKLNNKKVKPQPLPQILINKYRVEGKKVVDGFLIEGSNNGKDETTDITMKMERK